MSADNWAQCPRCAAQRQERLNKMVADLREAYGNVPVDEFDEMRARHAKAEATPPEPTFREDYEIYGAEDGELNVSYSGGCRECGLSHTFRHNEAMAL